MGNTGLNPFNEERLLIRSIDVTSGMVFYFSDNPRHWLDPKNRWWSILRFEVTMFYLESQTVNTVCPKICVCVREAGMPNGLCIEFRMSLSGLKKWVRPDPSPTAVVFKCLGLLPEHEREVVEYLCDP